MAASSCSPSVTWLYVSSVIEMLAIPEAFHHDLRVHAGTERHGGPAVPQVVQTNARQSQPPDVRSKRTSEAFGMQRITVDPAEDQVVAAPAAADLQAFLVLTFAVLPQDRDRSFVKCDGAPSLCGLRGAELNVVLDVDQGLADGRSALIEIEVLGPSEP